MRFDGSRPRPGAGADEVAGTRPALLFAVGLGTVTAAIVVGLFAGGAALVARVGGGEASTHGLLVGAAAWLAFWIGLTAGLAGGLSLGFRLWARIAAPRAARRARTHPLDERRAAVREAEALLQRTAPPRGRHPPA